MKCTNCNNELNSNATFCRYCGKTVKKKGIGVISIFSIILLALSVIATIGIFLFCIIGASGSGTEASQGYGWLLIIFAPIGAILCGYYAILVGISILCDYKLKNRTVKNVLVGISLVVPFLVVALFSMFILFDSSNRSFEIGDLKVDFPKDMNKTLESKDFVGKYTALGFYNREEEKATCSITISYSNNDDKPTIDNMKDGNTEKSIDKNTTTDDFIASSRYSLSSTTINGKKWDYLEYNQSTYYKIYGTTIKNKYYLIEIKDDHSSHTMCKQKEKEVLNSITYRSDIVE